MSSGVGNGGRIPDKEKFEIRIEPACFKACMTKS